MFDVDWSDPNRELVGDRRARKKKEKEKGRGTDDDGDDHESSSSRASESLRNSVSSVEKQFGFFGAKQRKKGASGSSRKAKSRSTPSSSLRASTIDERPRNDQTSLVPSSENRQNDEIGELGSLDLPDNLSTSFTGSVFSRLNDMECAPGGSLFGCDITNPQSGLTTQFQELGDGVSMITKTIETTSRPRTSEDGDSLLSTVAICIGDEDHQLTRASASKSATTPMLKPSRKSDLSNEIPQFMEVVRPLPGTTDSSSLREQVYDEPKQLPVIDENTRLERSENPTHQYKRRFRPKLSAPPISVAPQKPTDNPDTWKAPDDWEIEPSEDGTLGGAINPIVLDGSAELSAITLDITHMQRELDRMLKASPRIILQRLKDTWGCYDPEAEPRDNLEENPQLDEGVKIECDEAERALDAALAYKEREMENKRWLLSILNNMDAVLEAKVAPTKPKIKLEVQKALALFEAQATVSYVASVHHSIQVYHLSSDPLSDKRWPNVHPVVCPTISASGLNFAAGTFSTIYCLPITSILPSSEIPNFLQYIHHALMPGGRLEMIIIDPWPVAASMGPKLEDWLDENLIFNLELHFRCIHPSRMFPVWLEDAQLRADGSMITTTRFRAVARGRDHDSDISARSKDSTEVEQDIKKELRTTAGRLLWQDMWSPFVTGDQWWWEDPEIVEECMEMNTYWEYSIIEAHKKQESTAT